MTSRKLLAAGTDGWRVFGDLRVQLFWLNAIESNGLVPDVLTRVLKIRLLPHIARGSSPISKHPCQDIWVRGRS